jgi:hypothetical protein
MTPKNVKDEISEIVDDKYPQVELYEAKLSETDFDLEIVAYKKR